MKDKAENSSTLESGLERLFDVDDVSSNLGAMLSNLDTQSVSGSQQSQPLGNPKDIY